MSTAYGIAYGAFYGTSSTVANALCLIMDPATPEAGGVQVTVAAVGAPGESVGLAIDGSAWSPITTLGGPLSTSGPIASLPVAPTSAIVHTGDLLVTASGTHMQLWTVSSTTPANSDSIPVVSQTPNFAYPTATAVGTTLVLDVDGNALYTAVLPGLASGSHTLSGLGSNSGTYDLTFPVKFAPQSIASDLSTPTAPATSQQVKWRFFDPRVSTYSDGQSPRTNLAVYPRGTFWGLGNEWGFFESYDYGNYSRLTGQATPLLGVSTAVRKTVTTSNVSAFNVRLTQADANQLNALWGTSPNITPGAAYTISVYARTTRADAATTKSAFTYAWYDINGVVISNGVAPGQGLVSGSWVRQSFTVTAPKNAAMVALYFGMAAADAEPLIGDAIDLTGLLVEQSDRLDDWFDGDTVAADAIYEWAGVAGSSYSLAWPGYHEMLTNPKSWTSPSPVKNITHKSTPPLNGQILAWEGGQKTTTFEFSGTTRTQWEYRNLQCWAAKPVRFWLVDHRNVARLVMFTQFDASPRNSPTTPWESDYTMHVTQYEADDGFSYA